MNAMAEIRKVETWAEIKQRYIDDREAAILDQADMGMTLSETAAILETTTQALKSFIKIQGVCVKFARKTHESLKWSALVEHRRAMSKRGITAVQAAEMEGVHPDAMRIYSDKHGIKWKPQGRWPKVST